jgi:excinuclease UvrABC nuclease subunit
MAQQNPSVPAQQVIAPPRPAHATDRYDGPTILYRMFDADDRLLYVGITCNKQQRWDGHRQNSRWWPLVARKELATYPDRSTALTAERTAILSEQPIYNVSGNPAQPRAHVHLVLDGVRARKMRAFARSFGVSHTEALYQLIDELPDVADSDVERTAR